MEQIRVAGIVWYRLEDYDAARAIMEDGLQLPASYTAWRLGAEQGEKQMRRSGWATTRAYIHPAEFVTWCRDRGLKVDASARQEFANAVALNAAKDMHGH